MIACVVCGNEIEHPAGAWHEVVGWEKQREGGGTNHVALRERTGQVMCIHCMSKQQAGLDPGQLELV